MNRSATANFWGLGVLIGVIFAAASAPSPLYVVYQAKFGFSATTLTLIFAVYVFTLLGSLLFAGSVSDHAGRRPVLVVALVILLVAIALFIVADSVAVLLAARIVQGIATGLATGAVGAAILDHQPKDNPRLAPLLNSVSPLLGLAGGALLSGLLVQYAGHPLRLVYWILAGIYVLALGFALTLPETVERQSDWARSLVPRVNVPAPVRGTFAAVTPGLIGTWALGGLYLSLGPSIVLTLLQSTNHFVGGLVIVALAGTGAAAIPLARNVEATTTTLLGAIVVIFGVGITLTGIRAESTVLIFVGSAVAGGGFGPAFAGALRALVTIAPPTERAGLLSAVFIVCYTAFSVPAIIAGVFVPHTGLRETATIYAAAIMAFAALTVVQMARLRREQQREAAA